VRICRLPDKWGSIYYWVAAAGLAPTILVDNCAKNGHAGADFLRTPDERTGANGIFHNLAEILAHKKEEIGRLTRSSLIAESPQKWRSQLQRPMALHAVHNPAFDAATLR
jgi:hypothetical protein